LRKLLAGSSHVHYIFAKKYVKKFLDYEALVFTDHTAGNLNKAKKYANHPLLVLLGHGTGDGAHGYKETHNQFDMVLVAGTKKSERLEKAFPHGEFKLRIGG
jgi:hypothetical protein